MFTPIISKLGLFSYKRQSFYTISALKLMAQNIEKPGFFNMEIISILIDFGTDFCLFLGVVVAVPL